MNSTPASAAGAMRAMSQSTGRPGNERRPVGASRASHTTSIDALDGHRVVGCSTNCEMVPSKSRTSSESGAWSTSGRSASGIGIGLASFPCDATGYRTVLGLPLAVALDRRSACDDPAIRLTYRPKVGTRTVYRLNVTTSSTTKLGRRADPRPQRVLRAAFRSSWSAPPTPGDDTQVSVRLTGDGQQARDFVVRLDRAGQLATVETVEGVPAAALGNLGISELLPSAAGALPSAPLRPGDRWRISQLLRIGEARAGRLVGWGRLASLGVSDGTEAGHRRHRSRAARRPHHRRATEAAPIRLVGAVRTTMHVTQRVRRRRRARRHGAQRRPLQSDAVAADDRRRAAGHRHAARSS